MTNRDSVKDRGFVQFLGTGAGDCVELDEPDCKNNHCARAKALGGKNPRHASSLFIAPDVLVDFYGDAQMIKYGIAKDSIHHMLITHTHHDHFQPMSILEFASNLTHPLTVHGSANVENALDFAAGHKWDASAGNYVKVDRGTSNIEIRTVRPGEEFTIAGTRVMPVLANHMINKTHMILQEQSLNYVFQFESEGKSLFYGLDSSYTLPETLQNLTGFQLDIAVFDSTFGHRKIDPFISGHQNFAMLEQTLTRFREEGIIAQSTEIVISHISQHNVAPHDDIVEDLADIGIVLAHDGLILEF